MSLKIQKEEKKLREEKKQEEKKSNVIPSFLFLLEQDKQPGIKQER